MSEESKSDLERLFDISTNDSDLLTVQTTVDTGFEWQAVDECKEKISPNLRVVKDRGKIFFNVNSNDFSKVRKLRSVDNIYVIASIQYFPYDSENPDLNLNLFRESVRTCAQLKKCLNAWKEITRFPGKLYPSLEDYQSAVEIYKAEKEQNKNDEKVPGSKKRGCDPAFGGEDNVLSFRVSCERTGTHNFDSSQVACVIGGEMQDLYHWIVDLTTYQLEVLCKITHGQMIMGLRVTPESLHRRNIKYFGPTTLRATIAYNLLSLADPKPGDIIVDPMCGGGSIPIEGALELSQSFVIGGDNHEKAVERSRLNFAALKDSFKCDLIRWDVMQLPFKDSYIDAFVTDMPFGKRMGSMFDNRVLYKKYILELARAVRVKHGKIVLLTYDRRSMVGALQVAKNLLKVKKMLGVSMGGLNAAVYVLKRTNLSYEQFKLSISNFSNSSGQREYVKDNGN
ncbi:THUMP domain-containing protein 3 [Diachasma alloeum]|uniref:THUMP domain-containing protein 3 n=1 Tax=Diachasma alloeum TaxID=454923 RepID=UPI0007383CB7|nr:THUMP domain-containing protein 3 [Diachasma alloeum]XP_015127158.1 THUMP domain-containing protein 3 [Diachasma alloeum]